MSKTKKYTSIKINILLLFINIQYMKCLFIPSQMLEFQKYAKSDFLHNFFCQDFWNLKITENMYHHVVTPPHFF